MLKKDGFMVRILPSILTVVFLGSGITYQYGRECQANAEAVKQLGLLSDQVDSLKTRGSDTAVEALRETREIFENGSKVSVQNSKDIAAMRSTVDSILSNSKDTNAMVKTLVEYQMGKRP